MPSPGGWPTPTFRWPTGGARLPGRRDHRETQGFRDPDRQRRYDVEPIGMQVERAGDKRVALRRGEPEMSRRCAGNCRKLRLATTSLAGCFGCHMSFLDIDERLLDLIERVEFDRSPLTDIKHLRPLRHRPDRRRHLQRREHPRAARVSPQLQGADRRWRLCGQRRPAGAAQPSRPRSVPAGGLSDRYGIVGGQVPNDPELPLPLDKVHPIHEIVRIDYFIPGCPPSGDAIWKFLTDLLDGRTPRLGHPMLHFD
jgi:NAD-reducing hydrogenase small subunit